MEPLKLSQRGLTRRGLGLATLSGLGYFAASGLGRAGDSSAGQDLSIIVVWLAGGPSQIETFDPKPGKAIGGPTRAIKTAQKGIELAEGMPLLAEQMQHLSLVRSMVGQEGDHERASILMKTGRRPETVLTHPSLGAVCAHELPEGGAEIPRYVSILGYERTSRGGFLGPAYDPFRVGDPLFPVQDVSAQVGQERQKGRLASLDVLEQGFTERAAGVEARTTHRDRTARALAMMSSAQLAAFAVDDEPSAVRASYGDSALGRACLAARRLVEVGVRCVEVNHAIWDTHIDNFNQTGKLTAELDPALAGLVADLRARDRWRNTIVVCTGEFGRTPKINAAEGRDHWPSGFSLAIGGGPFRGGRVVGQTSDAQPSDDGEAPKDPVAVADLYATLITALGIDPATENMTSLGRPIKIAEGQVVRTLLDA
jgi:hypothetical protein